MLFADDEEFLEWLESIIDDRTELLERLRDSDG